MNPNSQQVTQAGPLPEPAPARFSGTDRYAPVRLLGQGGMGAVWEVKDAVTGGHVALKVMLDPSPHLLLRFKQEFRVVAELSHPNVVRLLDLGQHAGQWFFTMEMVDGRDLWDALGFQPTDSAPRSTREERREGLALGADGALHAVEELAFAPPSCDLEALTPALLQMLDALEFLHGHGIVHRDLKPSNVIVGRDGRLRVLDFGLASDSERQGRLSASGALIGTPAYLSPEQCLGQEVTPASDLYALGVILFELLTGTLPFEGSVMAMVQAHAHTRAPPVSARVAGVPPEYEALCARLLAKAPGSRPTLPEVRKALGGIPTRRPQVDATRHSFVGRHAERAQLRSLLARAKRGERTVAWVEGPSGMGKSALASHFVREARADGVLCLAGRCFEREQVPFLAFDRLTDALVLTLRGWSRDQLLPLREPLAALQPVFPVVQLVLDQIRERKPAAAVSAKERPEPLARALSAFVALVDAVQQQVPLLFVLDDLQWADAESIQLLDALLGSRTGRVMLLGLVRTEAISEPRPFAKRFANAGWAQRGERMVLGPLPAEEAARLAHAVARAPLEDETLAELTRQAGGVPLLTRQLAEFLARLPEPVRRARLADRVSLGGLLGELLGELSVEAEQLLGLAAAAGGDLSTRVLARASGLPGEQFERALSELTAAQFLRLLPPVAAEVGEAASSEPGVDLTHDKLRETAYARLTPERRRGLHLALAEALEGQERLRPRDVEALLRHWGAVGDRDKQRRFTVQAAERAEGQLAYGRAGELTRALALDPEPHETSLELSRRWERAGELFELGGRPADALEAFQRALPHWEQTQGAERDVRRLHLHGHQALNELLLGRLAASRDSWRRGLALLGLSSFDRPTWQTILVLVGLQAANWLAEVLPTAWVRRTANPWLQAQIHFLELMFWMNLPVWRLPASEAALRCGLLARTLDDKRLIQRSLASAAAVPAILMKGSPRQLERARRDLDRAEQLARTHSIPFGEESVQVNRALLWMASDMERARESVATALESCTRQGASETLDGILARTLYPLILGLKGDDEEALAFIEQDLRREAPNLIHEIEMLVIQAFGFIRTHQVDKALVTAERLTARLEGQPQSQFNFSHLVVEGRIQLALGKPDAVLALSEANAALQRGADVLQPGLVLTLWRDVLLEAELAVLRQGRATPALRSAIRAHATWLYEKGLLYFGCVGARGLALLEREAGNESAAQLWLERALEGSSRNCTDHVRWLCLEAARQLGAQTGEQQREAERLRVRRGFVAIDAADGKRPGA